MALDPTLASIPGLGGYLAMRNYNDQQQAGQLAQAGAFQTLQEHFRGQARDEAMRAELDAIPEAQRTPETIVKIGAKYASPKDLYTGAQKSLDNNARIASTKEQALARLTQAAQQFSSNMDIKIRQAANAEERTRLQAQANRGLAEFRANMVGITRARTADEIGAASLPPMIQMDVPSAPTAAPQQPGSALPPNVPESDRAAYEMARSGVPAVADRQVTPEEQARMADVPAAAPQPQAQPAPQPAPTQSAPMPDAENLDARDLQARSAAQAPAAVLPQPVTQNAPAGAVAAPGGAPAVPAMPPEIAKAPPKVQRQWLLQQTKASIAGGGQFTPQALNFTAKQYLTGDRQAIQGFARSTTARIALQNEIVDEAQRQGKSPEQVAALMADFAGIVAGSRTVGQRAANITLAATEAEEMMGVVRDTSAKFDRTSFVPVNAALKAYDTQTGSPEVKEFGAALNSFINVYARAINPTGVPTINDKEHARQLLSEANSPEQVNGVLKILGRELEIAKRAPGTVRAATSAAITGNRPGGDVEAAVKKAGYSYEPEKYEYRVGIGGQVQRKPK